MLRLPNSLHSDFNPRSPHGERRFGVAAVAFASEISIHAPRTESDDRYSIMDGTKRLFQSTLPARRATRHCDHGQPLGKISIHAPRTESDNR